MIGTNQKLHAQTIRLTMRVALCLALLQSCVPVFAADADPADPSVPKLEQKFFEHTYPKDPLPQRLERIEKMVFGETKTGADGERLAKLLQAVPQLNSLPDSSSASSSSTASASPSSGGSSSGGDREMAPPSRSHQGPATARGSEVTDAKYPQVSAMEQKLLGKEFAADPVDQRLARLETKVFGKPSSSTDLSDRVDALKSRTGVDLTQNVPNGADWADDDDTFMAPPSSQHRSPGSIASGGGRRSLSDANSVFNRSNRSSGGSDDQDVPFYGSGSYNKKNSSASASGSYGFSGGSSGSASASGSYGFGGNSGGNSGNGVYQRSSAPQTAYAPSPSAMPDTSSGMGLNQQVSALEQEVLNKTYLKDPLPVRVERLETNIIPKDKATWQDKPLPDRVSHLISIIPISAPSMVRNQRVAQGPSDMDPDFPEMSSAQAGAKPAPQRTGGGLSKIMNSLGNMFGGGGYGTGYSTGFGTSGTMVTDPQTGLMMDPTTGNLIDPSSGMVIGRRVVQPSYGGYNQYGMGMGGFNSFNNGFSPYGGGSSFGIGTGGVRFGRMGGMWP